VGRDDEQLVVGQQPDADACRRERERRDRLGRVPERGHLEAEPLRVPEVHRGLVLGLPREVRRPLPQGGLHLGVALGREVVRVEEAEVDVPRRRRQRVVVQRVEDDVADGAGVDQPVRRVDTPRRAQRRHEQRRAPNHLDKGFACQALALRVPT